MLDFRGRPSGTELAIAAVLVLCALFSSACSSIPVSVDFDPSISFSEFKSYAFLPDPPRAEQDPRLHNSLVDGRVRGAIRQQLSARGFSQVRLEDADFAITHHVGLETGIDVRTVHSAHRYSRAGWHLGPATHTTVREYERGTLLIDFVTSEDRQLMWRGSASTRLGQNASPDQREQRINDAVERILERFPPE